MAFNTYYTTTITTIEGNSLVYSLEQDAASTTPATMNITEKSYNLKYFFNDDNSTRVGLGYLSQLITLQFLESNEVDDIKTNPLDWRLRITLDGDLVFLGFPDVQSISEYAIPSYTDLYECTFSNVFARLSNESTNAIFSTIAASSNPIQATSLVPITDLIAEFVVGDLTGETNLVWVAHEIVSDNCVESGGVLRPDPQLRYFSVQVPSDVLGNANRTIGEILTEIARGFYLRMGWSPSQGKTIIAEATAGASGTYTGYDCTYSATTHRTITSSSNITLQTLSSSDFITDGRDVNADNPPFPKRATTAIQSGSDQIKENPNTTLSFLFDAEVSNSLYWKDDALSTADKDGISVYGRNALDTTNEQKVLFDVYPNRTDTGTQYELSELINKRLFEDYLFTYGLKGFTIKTDQVFDPMIPISYDSKVWVTPSGTINLFEETTDCLLIEIQDNA